MGAPKDDKAGVKQTWQALTDFGYEIIVLDGAGETFVGLDKKQAVEEAMSCDEGYFLVMEKGETSPENRIGWVWFVYGNSPEEVVCDYTTNLSHVIEPLTEKWW